MRQSTKHIINKTGLITIDILEVIFQLTEGVVDAFDRKSLYEKLKGHDNFIGSAALNNFRSLFSRGYLENAQLGNNCSVRLTNKGKLKLFENTTSTKVDGKWRLISFDIPEQMRRQRRRFRSTIKRFGFRQVQMSLWACPYEHADKVSLAISEYMIQEYVAYFVVERTDIEIHLRQLFNDVLN